MIRKEHWPFYPYEKRGGIWYVGCLWLTKEGRCVEYAKRPEVCKLFEPGVASHCAISAKGGK